MRLEWIEDLIAVAEAPTLTAAAMRRNVTQPAFTRRLRSIEEQLGLELIDRRHKPARPNATLLSRLKDLQAMAAQMRQITAEMAATAQGGSLVSIACQHALSLSVLSQIAPRLRESQPGVFLRLHAADHDDCYSMLMTGEAAMMFTYELAGAGNTDGDALVERRLVLHEALIPVVKTGSAVEQNLQTGQPVPLVSYPQESFLGIALERAFGNSQHKLFNLQSICETALTPAVLELVLSGTGIAWVPRALARPHLTCGRLQDLSHTIGRCDLDAVMLRLRTLRPRVEDDLWRNLQRAAAEIWR